MIENSWFIIIKISECYYQAPMIASLFFFVVFKNTY